MTRTRRPEVGRGLGSELLRRPDRRVRLGILPAASRAFDPRGQGIVEYGLILSLSACLAVILLVFFGGTISAVLEAVGDAIDAAS